MAEKMVNVRYTGTSSWARVILNDDGEFLRQESVAPNATVSLPESVAEHLCGDGSLPDSQKNFVLLPRTEEKREASTQRDQEERRQAPQGDRKS